MNHSKAILLPEYDNTCKWGKNTVWLEIFKDLSKNFCSFHGSITNLENFTHTYCACAVCGATCQHDLHSFLVYFAQLLCCYSSLPIFSSWLQATRSSWSSLEIGTFVVNCICQRESAECVGKQVVQSEWAKGTTLLQALSERKAEIGRQAEHSIVSCPDPTLPRGLRSGNETKHGVAAIVRCCPIVGQWVWLTYNQKQAEQVQRGDSQKLNHEKLRLIRSNFSPQKFLAIRQQ